MNQPTYKPCGPGQWTAVFPDGTEVGPLDWPGEQGFPGLGGDLGYHRTLYLAALGELAAEKPGEALKVLDCACGSGAGAELLLRHGHTVVGVDASAVCAEFAEEYLAGFKVERFRAYDGRLPHLKGLWLPEHFDAVVCIETIEHVEEDAEAVRRLFEMLRPGGLLFVSTPNRETKEVRGLPKGRYHVREYTRLEFQALLSGAGFEPIRYASALASEPLTQVALCRRPAK